MAEHWKTTFVLFLAGLCLASAAPIDSHRCDIISDCSGVQGKHPKYNYKHGHIYEYEWKSDIVTSLPGTTDETSHVKVSAHAKYYIKNECELVAEYSNAVLEGPHGEKYELTDLNNVPIHMGPTSDGRYVICTPASVSTSSLNIVRSTIANTHVSLPSLNAVRTTVSERDFYGNCPTEYTVEKSGNEVHVHKHKNLNQCSERQAARTIMDAVPYKSKSKIQTIPSFESTVDINLNIKNGVQHHAQIHEVNRLRRFSLHGKGATTEVNTEITLTGESEGTINPAGATEAHDLVFDDNVPHTIVTIPQATRHLKELCKSTERIAKYEAAEEFHHLVTDLRGLTRNQLKGIYRKVQGGEFCPRSQELEHILVHALIVAETPDSVGFVSELIASGAHEKHERLWYTILAFVKHPKPTTLVDVYQLIDKADVSKKALLGVSGLAHQLCRSDDHCGEYKEYKTLVNRIGKHLPANCKTTSHQDENKVLSVLKAIGNLDHLTDEVAQKIEQCIEEKSLPWRVRFAAFEAFRRDACRPDIKKVARHILKDVEEDSEVRIEAYRTLVRCPVEEDAVAIKYVLEHHEINQVESYISSHIHAVHESDSPLDKHIHDMLHDVHENKHGRYDPRRFSYHFARDRYLERLNLGYDLQADIVFSTKTYVPRFASVNATLLGFGKAVNFLEVGATLEGLERPIEKVFGPEGYFHDKDIYDIVKDGREAIKNLKNRRHRRDVSDNEIVAPNQVHLKETFDEEPNVDLYIRVFGTEVNWFDIDSEDHVGEDVLNKIDNMVKKAKNSEIDFTLPVYADFTLLFPTSSGLPLTLDVVASSVVSLQAKSKLDLPKILKDILHSDFSATFIPSVSTEIGFTQGITTPQLSAGLEVRANVHSASGLSIVMDSLEGKGFDLKLDFPLDDVRVFEVRNSIAWVHHDKDSDEEKDVVLSHPNLLEAEEKCSRAFLGLQWCAELSFPRVDEDQAMFPLSGPAHFKWHVKKENHELKGIHIRALVDKTDSHKKVDIVLETPGSLHERKISLQYERVVGQSIDATLDVVSPLKTVHAKTHLSRGGDKLGFDGTLKVDDRNYEVKGYFDVNSQGGKKIVYTPVIEYSTPNKQNVQLVTGKVTRIVGKKLELNLKTGSGVQKFDATLKGTINAEEDGNKLKYTATGLKWDSTNYHVGLDGFVAKNGPKSFATQIQVTYGVAANTWSFSGEYENLSEGNTYHFKTHGATQCSVHPNAAVSFEKEFKYVREEQRTLDTHAKVTFGETRVVYERKLHLTFNNKRDFHVDHELKLEIPKWDVHYDSKHKLDLKPKNLKHELEVHYGGDKTLKSELTYKRLDSSIFDHEVHAKLSCPEHVYELTDTRVTVEPGHVKHDWKLVANPGNTYDLNVEYKLNRGDEGYDFDGDAKFQRSNSPTPVHLTVKANRGSTQRKAHVELDFHGENKLKVTFEGHRNGPGDVTTESHIFVKNFVTFDHNCEYKRPNYHSIVNVLLSKYDRRIKREFSVKWADHKGDLTYDLLYDADRDPSKHIKAVGTVNVGNTIFNAPHTLHVQVDLPSSKVLKLDVETEYTNTETKKGLKWKSTVVEPDNDSHVVNINTLATIKDPLTYSFDRVADVQVQCNGHDLLKYHANLKHDVDSAGKHVLDFTFSGTGDVLPDGLEVSVHGNRKDGVFKLDGNYKRGSRIATLKSTGKLDLKSTRRVIDVDADITLPFEKVKTLKISSKYYRDREQHELHSYKSISWNGKSPLVSDVTIHIDPENRVFKIDAKGNLPDKPTSTFKFGVEHIRSKKELDIEFDLDFRGQRKVKIDIGGSRLEKTAHIIVDLDRRGAHITNPRFEQLHLIAEVKRPDSHTKLTHATFKLDDKQFFELNKKVTYDEGHRTIEATFTGFDGVHGKLTGQIDKRADKEYTAKGRLEVNDKIVEGEGDLKLGGVNDFEIKGGINSADVGKWDVKVSRKATGGRSKLAIDIRHGGDLVLGVNSDYTKKETSNGFTLQGKAEIEHETTGKLAGEYTVTHVNKNKKVDGEVGRDTDIELTLTVKGSPVKVNINLKKTNKEQRIFVGYHPEGDVIEVELQRLNNKPDSCDMDYTAHIFVKRNHGSEVYTRGVEEKLRWDDSGFHQDGKFYFNKEKDAFVGHDIFIKRGKEFTTTLHLLGHSPYIGVKRTVENNGRRHGEFAIAVDIKNHPDDKLSVDWELAPQETGKYNFNAVLKHKDLPRDYTVKGVIKKDDDFLSYKLDADIFAKPQNHLTLNGEIHRIYDVHGHNYTFELQAKSLALNIDVDYNSNTYFGTDGFFRTSTVDYLNHEGVKRQMHYELSFGRGQAGIVIDGFSGRHYQYLSKWHRDTINGRRGLVVETNIQFPGLKHLVVVREMTLAPSYKVKFYLEENKDRYLEFFSGFFHDDHVGFGVHRHLEGQTEELVDFSVGFDENLHLYGKSVWNKDNINAGLDRLKERGDRVRNAIREVVDDLVTLVRTHLRGRAAAIKSALPDFKPVLAANKQHWKRLFTEVKAEADYKYIQDIADQLEPFIGENGSDIPEMYNELKEHFLEVGHNLIDILREEIKQLREKVQNYRQKLRERFYEVAHELVDRIGTVVDKIRERIHGRFEKLRERVNKYLDEHPELKERIKQIRQKIQDLRLRIYNRLEQVCDRIHAIVERICERIHNSKLRLIIQNIRKHIREEHAEELEYIKERLTVLIHKLEARVDELFLGERFRGFIKRVLHIFEERLQSGTYSGSLIKAFFQDSRHLVETVVDRIFFVDLDSNILRIPELLPLPSLNEISHRLHDLASRFRDRQYNRPYTEKPSLIDRYFRFKSAISNPREILPPFKSVGSVIDSKYYVTFDGRAFVLAGHCSYQLASDYVDRNFVVDIRYEADKGNEAQKTFIYKNGKHTVEIGPDAVKNHQVLVDGNTVSASSKVGHVNIYQNEKGVAAKSDDGVKVACSSKADVCIVALNGFYYGKVDGLLGTNNHEQYDDLDKPDGHHAASAAEYAESWKLDQSCSAQPTQVEYIDELKDGEQLPDDCTDLFVKWTSSLRPCFSVLNRRPYAAICKKQHDAGHDVHSSAVAYAAACKVKKGLHVNV